MVCFSFWNKQKNNGSEVWPVGMLSSPPVWKSRIRPLRYMAPGKNQGPASFPEMVQSGEASPRPRATRMIPGTLGSFPLEAQGASETLSHEFAIHSWELGRKGARQVSNPKLHSEPKIEMPYLPVDAPSGHRNTATRITHRESQCADEGNTHLPQGTCCNKSLPPWLMDDGSV